MDATGGCEFGAAAVAFEGQSSCKQLLQRGAIQVHALVLECDVAIVVQAERLQRAQLVEGGPGDFAGWVDVLDAQPPFAAGLPRQQPAAERGQHRAGMQRSGRRGREPAPIGVAAGLAHACRAIS